MNTAIDPKELKTLGDILALVLEERPAPSATALETLRRRARQNGVTGGALKNLFREVSAGMPPPRAPAHAPAQAGHGHGSAATRAPPADERPRDAAGSAEQLRAALRDAQRRFVEVRLQLDRETRESARLRDKLRALEAGQAHCQDTVRLRGRIGDLERQLLHLDDLQAKLTETTDALQAMQGQLRAEQRQHALPRALARALGAPRWRAGLATACMLGLLSADQPAIGSGQTGAIVDARTEWCRPAGAGHTAPLAGHQLQK